MHVCFDLSLTDIIIGFVVLWFVSTPIVGGLLESAPSHDPRKNAQFLAILFWPLWLPIAAPVLFVRVLIYWATLGSKW